MKELTREIKEVYGYEASDGTIFDDKAECLKYEESAKMIVRKRFNDLVVGDTTEEGLFNSGYDDTIMYIVNVKNEKDVDTINQYGYLLTQCKCNIVSDDDIGSEVIIGHCEDYLWRKGTLQELLDKITNNYNEAKEMYEKKK